MEEND